MSAAPQQAPYAGIFRAHNGTRLIVRPLERTDTPALGRMWDRLSPETIYMRFMTPWPKGLPAAMVEQLIGVDHNRREALVAVHRGEIVGVARYYVVAEKEAEVAVLVEDAWQRQGIARRLFADLAMIASERGIETFSGAMLAENRPAVQMLKAIAPDVQTRIENGELTFRFGTKAEGIASGTSFDEKRGRATLIVK